MQASATLHELVHTLGGWHGGATPTFTTTYRPTVFVQPNCKPFYFSSMSYLFEAAGIVDASGGAPQVRLSAEANNLDETNLVDGAFSLPFRPGWYSPLLDPDGNPTTLAAVLGVPPAKKFCNGALFGVDPPSPPMGRLDATLTPGLSWSVDWAGDGGAVVLAQQDANFDGAETGDLANLVGFNDWPGLRLNQVGAGRNMAGMSVGQGLDFGGLDFGGLDFGGVELEYDTIIESGGTPPSQLEVCVLGGSTGFACAPADDDPLHRHRLNWVAPTVGTVDAGGYQVLRVFGAALTPASVIDEVATGVAATTVDDLEELPDLETFLYFVRASVAGVLGGPSNLATVVAENNPPSVADGDVVADSYSTDLDTELIVAAAEGVLANDSAGADSEPTSLRAVLDEGPDHGALTFGPDGSFTYMPEPDFVGDDSFTYRADNGFWSGDPSILLSGPSDPVTVDIEVLDVVLPWVATDTGSCDAVGEEIPDVTVDGNAVMMGLTTQSDTSQDSCIHGASALLPPLTGDNTKYEVTFTYNLFTWDSYNDASLPGPTGFWDSFSVTVSKDPYAALGLSDPITVGQSGGDLTGVGFLWGGDDFGGLECNPSAEGSCTGAIPAAETTVEIPGNGGGDSYLNVVLDTVTEPESNHAHPSYGTITILSVVQVP